MIQLPVLLHTVPVRTRQYLVRVQVPHRVIILRVTVHRIHPQTYLVPVQVLSHLLYLRVPAYVNQLTNHEWPTASLRESIISTIIPSNNEPVSQPSDHPTFTSPSDSRPNISPSGELSFSSSFSRLNPCCMSKR